MTPAGGDPTPCAARTVCAARLHPHGVDPMPQSDALPPRRPIILTSTGAPRGPAPSRTPPAPARGAEDPQAPGPLARFRQHRAALRLARLEALKLERPGKAPPAAPAPVSEPSAARALVARAKATFRRLNQYRT